MSAKQQWRTLFLGCCFVMGAAFAVALAEGAEGHVVAAMVSGTVGAAAACIATGLVASIGRTR